MSATRRAFLRGAGALVLGFQVPLATRAAHAATTTQATPTPPTTPPAAVIAPNAFLRIGADDTVTILLAHSEMGQGMWTGLAMLLAEELECDWAKVRCEHAPADVALYARKGRGVQMTGGSSSIRSEVERYGGVGATARDMLVRAAAARWKVRPAACRVANGVIRHGAKSLRFGEVAEAAMQLAPAKVALKPASQWKLIGTPVKRLDTPEKITGTAVFGIDVKVPDARTAVIARPPSFGAELIDFDATAALQIRDVEQVVKSGNGVAVVAKHFWAAKLGRDALVVRWRERDEPFDSDAFDAHLRSLAKAPGVVAEHGGQVDEVVAIAPKVHEAVYSVPYLAHAPMEPLNCTARVTGDRCELWTGTQFQTVDQQLVAKALGTTPEKVQIHTAFLGGGFGRRANPQSDFVVEAAVVAKAAGVPVKVVWTREDDLRGGWYRPAFAHRMRVAVDAAGLPTAWDHVAAGQSILAGTPFDRGQLKSGIDPSSIEGLAESPYLKPIAARRISLHSPKAPVPVQWWRAVGATHTAIAVECMIDELAHAARQDPLAYRLALLEQSPRHAGALRLAAEKAGWSAPPPPGRARGLAVFECFGSVVAEVAEVSIEAGEIRVHEVTCAIDCGVAVNPLSIEAQIQSCVVYGLSAALHGKITVKNGRAVESNFHDYRPLRMHEMPRVATHIIANGDPMGGIGEPATAPIAPAVANAVFALTKRRLRTFPLSLRGAS